MFEQLLRNYFDLFSSKNLLELEKMFDPLITLQDWNIQASGLCNVVEETAKIFSSVSSIQVKPLHIYIDSANCTAIAELHIIIDESECLNVVDIVKFTDQGKIFSINAYQQ